MRHSNLEIDVEDTAHLILGFKGLHHVRPVVANLSMDFIRHDTTRTCLAIGAEGSLRWNGLTGEVALFKCGESVWRTLVSHKPGRDESYIAEWQHLLKAVALQEVPLVTGEDGLRVMQIIEAARRASMSGCQEQVLQEGNYKEVT
jgi:predicted dehydrogenase